MIFPSIDELLKKVDNSFKLVIIAAKRAKQLNMELKETGQYPLPDTLSMALEEIRQGKISYSSPDKSEGLQEN